MISPLLRHALKADLTTPEGRATLAQHLAAQPERQSRSADVLDTEVAELADRLHELRGGR